MTIVIFLYKDGLPCYNSRIYGHRTTGKEYLMAKTADTIAIYSRKSRYTGKGESIGNQIDLCRETLSSLVDLYISNNDLRMNAIMKRLTIVSTLFIPLTFLVGVWGMNFKIMPELDWRYGYFIAWAVMIVTGVLTWLYMKRKDWY